MQHRAAAATAGVEKECVPCGTCFGEDDRLDGSPARWYGDDPAYGKPVLPCRSSYSYGHGLDVRQLMVGVGTYF